MKVKVAVLQYEVPMDTKGSIIRLDEMVSQAEWGGAKLVVAPETAIGDAGEVRDTGVDYLPNLADIAHRHKVFLSTSYYKKEEDGIFNQGYIISPDGKPAVSYKKIYPAKPEVEEIGVEQGNDVSITVTEIGKLGMLICKDGFNKYSHFLYEKLGELGVEIICIPAWSIGWKKSPGVTNEEYVRALYIYGSFLSRAYVLMAGNLNKQTESFGRSLVVSPVRGVIKEGSKDRKEILYEELDLDEVKKAKEFDSWWQPGKRII